MSVLGSPKVFKAALAVRSKISSIRMYSQSVLDNGKLEDEHKVEIRRLIYEVFELTNGLAQAMRKDLNLKDEGAIAYRYPSLEQPLT